MSNPIEANNRDSNAVRNVDSIGSWTEGAGPIGGLGNAIDNLKRDDPFSAGIELAGAGLDALGWIDNPMKGLASAGIGWLIEHVGFLNDFLSALAGDPGMVADQAQTWTNIGDHVTARVEELRQSVHTLSAQGFAVATYSEAVEQFAAVVAASTHHAYSAANATHNAGTLVATTRSLVRDWIADWSADRITKWIAASALTPVTFGGAQAAFITDSVISGARLAGRASAELRILARQLDKMATGAASSGQALKQAARTLDDVASGKGATRLAKWVTDEGQLAHQMGALGATAQKHVDELAVANKNVAKAATRRAATGKRISDRGAPGTQAQKKAAHSQAKNQHTAAQAKTARTADALDDVANQALQVVDNVNKLRQRVNDLTTASGLAVTKAVKEVVVQTSNEDQRAEKTEKGYQDAQRTGPQTLAHEQAQPTGNFSPSDQNDAGTTAPVGGQNDLSADTPSGQQPARSTRQETWHMQGTLDD